MIDTPITEILSVDSSVADADGLLAGLRPGIESIGLDSDRDEMTAIAEALRQWPTVLPVHVLPHGRPRFIHQDAANLNLESIALNGNEQQQTSKPVQESKSDPRTLMLFNCEVGSDKASEQSLHRFQKVIGITIDSNRTSELAAVYPAFDPGIDEPQIVH